MSDEKGAVEKVDEGAARGAVSDKPSSRRPKKKWPVAVGVVAAVAIVAGAGFWVWHEQPSFCNAVCHNPMDAYVEGYYGDESLEAHAHQVAGTTCLECHEAKIEEQVHEAMVWASGDFATDEAGMLTKVGVRSDAKMCATSGCHDYGDVVAATENWGGRAGVNPHDSHQGHELDCSNCHSEHGQSIMYCNTCHDYELPEGWANPATEPAE